MTLPGSDFSVVIRKFDRMALFIGIGELPMPVAAPDPIEGETDRMAILQAETEERCLLPSADCAGDGQPDIQRRPRR